MTSIGHTFLPFLLGRLPLVEGQRVAVEERRQLQPEQRRQPLQLRLGEALDVHAAVLFWPFLGIVELFSGWSQSEDVSTVWLQI